MTIQHKNRDREEGMEWKDHQDQGELIKLVIVGWGVRKREALKTEEPRLWKEEMSPAEGDVKQVGD